MVFRSKSFVPALLGLIALVYLTSVTVRSMTKLPFVDEAWYSIPAWNLIRNGSMGTPVLETSASPMPGMNVSLFRAEQRTYWMMPLPIVVQAGWYKIHGFSLVSLRIFSVLWGLLALLALYSILRTLTGDPLVAAVALAFVATDTVFLTTASIGRMDMMSAALGFLGLAAYLRLRQTSLARAACVSHAFVAASGLTHPNGGLMALVALIFLMLHLDRQRLGRRCVWLSLLPYAVGGSAMVVYILQDPEAFSRQFFGNSGGRFTAIATPLAALWREITSRYFSVYGLNPELGPVSRLKVIVLLAYATALIGVLASRQLRRDHRTLLLLAGVSFLTLTFLDNYKVAWYLIYTVPFLAAITGIWFFALRRTGIALGVLVVMLQVGAVWRQAARARYQREYLPAVQFVRERAAPGAVVMASAEFGFALDFEGIVDDIRLGYHSGRQPEIVVMGDRFEAGMRAFQRLEPEVYQHMLALTKQMEPEFRSPAYTIYTRGAK